MIAERLTNDNSPDINKDEERNVGNLLQREDEWKDMIWQGLAEAVKRVKGMAGVRCWHDPLVVLFMEVLVDERMVQAAVDPVDPEVRKEDEERELEVRIPPAGALLNAVVHLRVAAHLGREEGHHKDRHGRDGPDGLSDLLTHLVLQEAWMREGGLVEDEDV